MANPNLYPKAILETYPKEALKQDRFGRTPMQYAIESKKLDAGKNVQQISSAVCSRSHLNHFSWNADKIPTNPQTGDLQMDRHK